MDEGFSSAEVTMKRYLAIFLFFYLCADRLEAAPGDLKWAFSTGGAVRSSPALATNGLIIFGSHDSNVYAVNTAGELRWKTVTGGKVVSSPAISGDTVYIGVTKGLIALDLSNGKEHWHFETFLRNAVISSPAIASSNLVCVHDSYGRLYGLDRLSGQKKWETNLYQFVNNAVCYSSPVVNREGVLFVGAASLGWDGEPPSGFLAAVDATSGKILWNVRGTNGFQSTAAIGPNGTLYFGGFDKCVHAIDPLSGVEKWVHLTGDSISASPAIGPDGTLFVGTHDGNLYAFKSQTGARKEWKFLTGDSIHSSVAIAADGTIYFGSYDKNFYALDGATGQKKWSFTTSGLVLSSPVIGPDGTVYVGSHDGKLYAFEGSAPPAGSAWPMFKGNPGRTGRWE
jgi:outer membrane protein assembly factor BamB